MKGIGGTSRFQEEKETQEGEGLFWHALEEEGCSNHVRRQGELGPAASASGMWPKMSGRIRRNKPLS